MKKTSIAMMMIRTSFQYLPSVTVFMIKNESVEQVAALFLLTLKEKYRLTQASLDFALGSSTNIVNMTVRNIKESLQSQ